MEIKEYCNDYFDSIYEVIHKTIEEIYPKYYPRSAVDFFHNHHSKENMKKQLPNEYTLVIFENNKIIGTGTLAGNEIKRFFILPEYQGNGYGKLLLKELEKNINDEKYNKFILDSSLGAVKFYEKNGFEYKKYMTIDLSDGNNLCYLEMDKNINEKYEINYDKRIFTSIENSENGEINDETIFEYHQNKGIIWAEYYGGLIEKGFLVGLVKNNGELEFNYEHINIYNEIRTGKCKSNPVIMEDGRIKLLEKWEWTNGDKSKGESIIIEKI